MLNIEQEGHVAIVTLDNPPVNAIGQAMRQELQQAVAFIDSQESVQAVVLIAAGRTFIAGADITEFGKPPEPPHLPDVIASIEQADKPWVAAIHGSALGGGLEIALGCHYRIAAHSARLGLPEVTLGLVPGAGGSVRLSRLLSAENAVAMVTSGKPVTATEALENGLIDLVTADEDLRRTALDFAGQIIGKALPTGLRYREPLESPDTGFWEAQTQQIARRARGQVSPLRALDCVRQGIELSVEEALAHERKTFLELRASDQAAALRHVFFAERAAPRPPELKDIAVRAVRSVAVIGGGTMGAGIAAALRDANLPVVLIERDEAALQRGRENVARIFNSALKRGRLNEAQCKARLEAITYSVDYAALADIDVVIEAVFEDLDVKRAVFDQLDAVCRSDTILATNTSYLDPDAIASRSRHPGRVLGLHFFSPANVMKLLEIIPTQTTQTEVLATAFALARTLRKIPVQAGICDGFIGNRILKVTRAQAERLLLSGATPAEVDRAMRAFGMPMGPFEAQDLGGLDIAAFQRSAARGRGDSPFAPVADKLVAMNRLGQKSSAGWYDYVPGDRTSQPSETVAAIISEQSTSAGLSVTNYSDLDIVDHIVLPMINEGARILEEGLASGAQDIDLVEIHGYGFPRWRGGLMHHAQTVGLAGIVAKLQAMAALRMCDEPCTYLLDAARDAAWDTARDTARDAAKVESFAK
ncbi:3-hydroxyacyl-CoA dehydrogenase NAD-binding domain-containing protein [Granulosicoccus antarcticus]|uniref:Fatty acid oxidation complex subunit alpha n=1 Tax=Granulosicoccus antarcticus IMCC3135 TaxID=1192854 RepID=A0A2Z2P1U1_9GAMM|nr:3-hydroxyacyl-CoA dehydrogenase NAD-binding domain-containing protein [Granulosicoccus antarcticus]ASJ76825.1 Fatty acid oxidation complex subunit alpha [Granulosicoccus antarcticus IMCC3135]